jgi:hypothetical protein
MKICYACQKPFDEVHPLDFLNDMLNCREMNERIRPLLDTNRRGSFIHPAYADRTLCRQDHTWRQHVAESWHGTWFNPHFPIEVPDFDSGKDVANAR